MLTPTPASLIPGIGPGIVDATRAALDALGVAFDGDVRQAGDPLPETTLDGIRRTRLTLRSSLETLSAGGYCSSNVRLREAFDL